METLTKKYCYSCFYGLASDSVLNALYIKDALLDKEGFVKLFEIENRKLFAKIDTEGKLEAVIYKADYLEKIDNISFNNESLEVITRLLNRLKIAFIGLHHITRQDKYIAATRYNHQPNIEILDYETGSKELFVTVDISMDMSFTFSPSYCPAILTKVCEVLTVSNPNIDEYIERFLSLENLSSDPVLHLLTVSSLYEYIKETSDKHLDSQFNEARIGIIGKEKVGKKNFQDKELTFKDKFICTRNLVAHGLVDEYTTVYNLEKIVKIAPLESTSGKKFYSFDRYNPSHINLINEVISEVQPMIQKYLRKELGL